MVQQGAHGVQTEHLDDGPGALSAGVRIGTCLQEGAGGPLVLDEDGAGQRGLPASVHPVHIRSALQQLEHQVRVSVVGRQDEQGVALVVGESTGMPWSMTEVTSSVRPSRAMSKTEFRNSICSSVSGGGVCSLMSSA